MEFVAGSIAGAAGQLVGHPLDCVKTRLQSESGVMHKALRAYSHEAFAIGTAYDARPPSFRDTVGMFVNTVLVPFAKTL